METALLVSQRRLLLQYNQPTGGRKEGGEGGGQSARTQAEPAAAFAVYLAGCSCSASCPVPQLVARRVQRSKARRRIYLFYLLASSIHLDMFSFTFAFWLAMVLVGIRNLELLSTFFLHLFVFVSNKYAVQLKPIYRTNYCDSGRADTNPSSTPSIKEETVKCGEHKQYLQS